MQLPSEGEALARFERSFPERSPQRVADILVDVLAQHGVDTVFGIPGGAIAPVSDALLGRPDIRVVTTKHEAGALFAAAGYARTSGRLGVALVTSGPGVLNAMTGLASAFCDGLPVLLLAGEVARPQQGKGVLQDGSGHHLNIIEMLKNISKMAVEVPEATNAPAMLHKAVVTALAGRPGPVALTLPLNVTTAHIQPPLVNVDMETVFRLHPAALAPVVSLLTSNKRCAILAGAGARGNGTPEALRAFAEHLQLPVLTTPKGKGVFPESHPLSLGVFGLGGHPSAQAYVNEGVDVLLAVGTSLGDVATDGFSKNLQPKRALVHIDIEPAQLGRSYPPDISLVAPAKKVLNALQDTMPAVTEPQRYGVRQHSDPARTTHAPGNNISPARAVWEIQQALPDDSIYVIDSGEHFLFAAHYLTLDEPDSFIAMTGLGSMGSSVGGAIGALRARPNRSVAVIMGDGGFAMVGTEIATAVAERMPLVVFVFNDERLGMCEIGHSQVFGRTPDYPVHLDVCEMARGLGADTARVSLPDELAEVLAERRVNRPLVIDVQIDRDVRLPKKDRVGAMAGGSLVVVRPLGETRDPQ